MIFALVGNQNCGKTTLFNQLTGSNQHVGNFPGVTVEQKIGAMRSAKNCSVVDLPGVYSLRPYTKEEMVTRDFIINQKPDGIINILDATNIERNLYLTLQLLEMQIPMVIALNMMDEVRKNGGTIDVISMSNLLGVPVIPISAAKNQGVDELITEAINIVKTHSNPIKHDFCSSGPVHRCIHAVSHLIEDHAIAAEMSPRFAATKLIEGDDDIKNRLKLSLEELSMLEQSVADMERHHGFDRNAALADMRYRYIEDLCRKTVVKSHESAEHKRSIRMDNILTHRFLAIPIFLFIMISIFYLTFSVIGAFLQELLQGGIDLICGAAEKWLIAYGINPVVKSLVIDGIFAGVGSVVSFLPLIVVLFFFLSILEDTGYMARVAFVMDKLLRKIGLSGRSFVPMLIGFGCTVPAVMAARTLASERDRKLTIMLVPFMSCSAKIPIYAAFCSAFFEKQGWIVMSGLYIGGIIFGILIALILKATCFKGNPVPFVMELPNYRLPSVKSVALLMWDKAKDFLQRAFSVIFIATVIIWFLQSFDLHLNFVTNSSSSLLAIIGKAISPIFKPLGFNSWEAATALITGFTAKEAVISTLSVLSSGGLASIFSPTTALSFLVFTLLYTPCAAAVAAIRRELGSTIQTIGVVVLQCVVAWLAGFAVYNIASLLI